MKIIKISIFALVAMLFFACSSDLENTLSQENELDAVTAKTIVTSSELSGFADDILADIFEANVSGKSTKNVDCYTSETLGQTTTITFTDCVIEDSEPVNGTLIAEYFIDGLTIGLRITYTDLSVGANQISGTREMYIGSSNEAGMSSIPIETDMQLVLEDGTVITEKGSKILWYTTDMTQEQKIALAGEWAVTKNGKEYQVIIENNLETTLPCEYISKGLLYIYEGDVFASIDFGDGTCDNIALFTDPNGTTEEINLRD